MQTIAKRIDGAGAVTLMIAGKFSGGSLGELRRAIEGALRMHKEVAVDLSEVTLVDRSCLQFLAARQDIKLINCPEYIQPWICRESSSS
jgi:anti-anti-sigma regulatory factor